MKKVHVANKYGRYTLCGRTYRKTQWHVLLATNKTYKVTCAQCLIRIIQPGLKCANFYGQVCTIVGTHNYMGCDVFIEEWDGDIVRKSVKEFSRDYRIL